MGAILTAASVLNAPGAETPGVNAACDVIRRQASRMSRLLDDLLDVARVTQGKITLRMELVDLVEACRSSIEAVRPMVEAHRHQCQSRYPEQPVWVRADRVRLVQVLENLLTNAIKYTDDTGLIEVVVSRRGSRAVVLVRDNGRGMPIELIETIFDMFVQSDETLDRSDGGMGVGLTLVRSLLQMQDGTIEARSAGPGQGSEFVVELPLAQPPPAGPTEVASARTGDSTVSTRLILVEDDDDARDMLASLLQRYGQEVVATASDGLEGFDKIMKLRPEVAILDIGLPKLDGYSLGRKLRDQLGDQIYLIAVTGYGRNEDRETVIESGFDQHLVKPVDIKQLIRLLQIRNKQVK
jgi:CheY-like chemotaxis protein/two-component sensor histidine kinase